MDRFADTWALITGGGSGIGAAFARRLVAEGGRVVILDVAGDSAASVADDLGDNAVAVTADVASDTEVARALAVVSEASGGRLDVVANVAGVGFYRHLDDTTVEEFRRLLEVNLLGPFRVTKAAVPLLRAASGSVINVASAAALNGRAYLSAYSSTKGGLVALTRSLAVELAPEVRVNAVCPGGVDTPLLEQFRPPEGADAQRLGRHPSLIDRLSTPEEIAASMAALAAPEAASTTGAVVLVDGGCAA